jgi:hypothetical protein
VKVGGDSVAERKRKRQITTRLHKVFLMKLDVLFCHYVILSAWWNLSSPQPSHYSKLGLQHFAVVKSF